MTKDNFLTRTKKQFYEFKDSFNEPSKLMRRRRITKKLITSIFRFVLLFGLSFVILFPTIQQILMGLRAPEDVNNPAVIWIPLKWSIENFKVASIVLDYPKAVLSTAIYSFISMILQIASTALAGYAFSRLKFKGSNILFIGVILTIIIPPQALSLAQYLYFVDLKLVGSELSIYLISGLGMGIRSGIFIYIFRSFFQGLPKELEESAQIDGAGVFRTFWSVMLPNARGAIVTVGLFAFVWQWNDTYFAKLFDVSRESFPLLTMRLMSVAENINSMRARFTYTGLVSVIGNDVFSNELFLALIINVSALLMMLPLLIMYLFVQKQFIESIERTGIVG